MAEWQKITDLPTPFESGSKKYKVAIEGMPREDGTWAGRIVFRDGTATRATERETTQPNRDAVEYWATGLEKVYLEGAFKRAKSG